MCFLRVRVWPGELPAVAGRPRAQDRPLVQVFVKLAHLKCGVKTYRRDNMKKRERHREFDVGARVVVNEKAPGGYKARLGTVLEIVLGSRYGVRFDNQQEPIVYLNSEWLDPAP